MPPVEVIEDTQGITLYADLPGVVDAIIGHVHKEVQCS